MIRSCHDRQLSTGDKISEFIANVPIVAESIATVGTKKVSPYPKTRSIHPPRKSRRTNLKISAATIELANSNYGRKTNTLPKSLSVNVVKAFEQSPPLGDKPIEWTLLTSEPITKQADVIRIIETYKRRWLIEEFFKVLKTGCRLEDRLMSSEQAWYNVLTLLLGVAAQVLNLRVADDKKLSSTNHSPFTAAEFAVLRAMAKKYNLPLKNLNDAVLIVAKMGGHIINKSYSPGWLVICRGYEKFISMVFGYNLAQI